MKSTHVSHLLLLAVLAILAGPSDAAVTSCEAACPPGDVSCLRGCFPVPAGRLLRRQGRQRGGSRRGKAADIRNNRQAQIQNQQDDAANEAADQGQDAPAVGGIGGVDPATGQVLEALPPPSNFCRQSGQSLADGTQQQGGFCSSVPQGQIPEVNKMVSSLIIEPDNNANIGLGEGFRVTVLSRNLNTGFFTVAASEYYTQPQTLNDQGIVQGHQHVTIQRLASLTEAPDANQKDFFQGLNDAAGADGSLFVDVPAGTLNTPGTYRICSMSGAFSHQPTVMPIAQRGAQDDCIRVNVGANNGDGSDAANAGGNDAGNANANAVGNGAGNNAGNGAGNNAGNGAGNNAGNGAGNNAGNGAGNNAGNGAGNNAGNGAGNNAGNGAGNNAGNGAGNNAGNGAGNNRGGGRFGGFGNRGAAGRGVGGRRRV